MNLTVRSATNRDCARVQELVFGILADYGLQPDTDGTDRDIYDIEGSYSGRGGRFDVLEDETGTIVGTIGLYPLDAETIELRKMYFAPAIRGRGIGKEMLRRMIDASRELGYKRIYLETATVLKEAVGLYESFGFSPTPERHTPRCDAAYVLDL